MMLTTCISKFHQQKFMLKTNLFAVNNQPKYTHLCLWKTRQDPEKREDETPTKLKSRAVLFFNRSMLLWSIWISGSLVLWGLCISLHPPGFPRHPPPPASTRPHSDASCILGCRQKFIHILECYSVKDQSTSKMIEQSLFLIQSINQATSS